MMADCHAFDFANPVLEDLLLDFVARYNLFRAFVLDCLEFDKAQVFALLPSVVPHP